MTRPNRHLPGQVRLLGRRTTQRQFLLRPDREGEVNNILGYCYALAALQHGVDIHVFMAMDNHTHSVVTDHTGKCSDVMQDAHAKIGRCMNKRLKRRESLWSSDKPGNTLLLDTPTVVESIFYVMMNPVTAGLVERVDQWKGFKITPDDWHKELTFTKPAFFSDPDLPETVTIVPTPPPGFEGRKLEDVKAFFRNEIKRREKDRRNERRRKKERVKGMKKCFEMSPFSTPRKSVKMFTLNPRFSGRGSGLLTDAIQCMREFWKKYHKAWKRLKARKRAEFPAGTLRFCTLACLAEPGDPHLIQYQKFRF